MFLALALVGVSIVPSPNVNTATPSSPVPAAALTAIQSVTWEPICHVWSSSILVERRDATLPNGDHITQFRTSPLKKSTVVNKYDNYTVRLANNQPTATVGSGYFTINSITAPLVQNAQDPSVWEATLFVPLGAVDPSWAPGTNTWISAIYNNTGTLIVGDNWAN